MSPQTITFEGQGREWGRCTISNNSELAPSVSLTLGYIVSLRWVRGTGGSHTSEQTLEVFHPRQGGFSKTRATFCVASGGRRLSCASQMGKWRGSLSRLS